MRQRTTTRHLPEQARPSPHRRGLTLVEVCISTIVITVIFLGLAGTLRTNMLAVGSAERMTEAALFLETTMESLATQPVDNLLVMNGDRLFDADPAAAANFAVDVTAFSAGIDLIQLRATLTDLQSGRELGRVTTLRSRR